MQVIIPNTVSQGSFTRASTANYWNSSGVLTSAANDVLRIGYNPLSLTDPPAAMIEAAATNLLLNSATLSTQSVTVISNAYALSFYGTGTVVISGTHSHTVVGVGASPRRTTYTFTPTAGAITLTVTGSVLNAQLETGVTASSWITTTGSTATRAADIATDGLIYSNIPEPDSTWPAWSGGTAYVVGNKVSYLHRQYNCVINNTNRNPLTDTTTPPAWTDAGPTNRYAMFDSVVGTSTSSTSSNITVVIRGSYINGLAFMQMVADKLQFTLSDGVNILSSESLGLAGGVVTDWWQYFTTPIKRTANWTFNDLPNVLNGVLTIVITTASGTVSIGNMVAGSIFTFVNSGTSNAIASSPTVGIIDYSVKTTDAFGNTSWTKRGYANRMNVKMMIDSIQVDNCVQQLAAIRATPCVWIGANNVYQSLIVYGAYKDWEVEIAYTNKSYCSLQIEGLA